MYAHTSVCLWVNSADSQAPNLEPSKRKQYHLRHRLKHKQPLDDIKHPLFLFCFFKKKKSLVRNTELTEFLSTLLDTDPKQTPSSGLFPNSDLKNGHLKLKWISAAVWEGCVEITHFSTHSGKWVPHINYASYGPRKDQWALMALGHVRGQEELPRFIFLLQARFHDHSVMFSVPLPEGVFG